MTSSSTVWSRLEKVCVVLSWASMHWPVFAIALSLVSPISPHLRLTADDPRASCAYGGIHGIVWEEFDRSCPLIALIDTRGRGQW